MIHLRDRNSGRLPAEEVEPIPSLNDSFPLDREVESAASAAQKALQDVVAPKLHCQLMAGNSRLPYHDHRRPDLQAVTNVKIPLQQPFGREVLAEHSVGKLRSRQLSAPECMML